MKVRGRVDVSRYYDYFWQLLLALQVSHTTREALFFPGITEVNIYFLGSNKTVQHSSSNFCVCVYKMHPQSTKIIHYIRIS